MRPTQQPAWTLRWHAGLALITSTLGVYSHALFQMTEETRHDL